ncbi:MAG: 50S ribosomal protein L21 [Syntrophothermus sp.]|uniref:50S ribosomal protein L21 n=1 Tax=Syntrophothermus sp. TaxID=2736299 RepID=UPI00257E8FAF|nr:50S ribosomal protein L21 [Syntrophothermus sp.]NSW82137.1 50S ribosomal protein L21 [Syntrophothermus sp.]
MYAIIETGGKQYRVEPGKVLTVEKLNADVGSQVEIETVLAAKNEAMFKVGRPYVEGARVRATVLEHGKGRKIVVFKYKPKKNYKKKQGHRQPFTRIRIDEIVF